MKDRHPHELAVLGKEIARERLEAGMSQDKLAELSGLDRSYISRLERGKANPTILTLRKIAGALKVDLARLVSTGD